MADALQVSRSAAIPLSEVEIRTTRSSGPGGQHANVTASRVEASWDVEASRALSAGDKARVKARCGPRVTAVAQDTRSQARNRDLALERLRSRVAAALVRPKQRHRTRPTRASKERRLQGKKKRSDVKAKRRRPEV
ncbi:MAG: aminoacyl-tRNA hydrolase [Thermoleophilaceae bacterium]|nr:aminoacyl-tRNA hydrolase [Thermoleophilaceae bacterium]